MCKYYLVYLLIKGEFQLGPIIGHLDIKTPCRLFYTCNQKIKTDDPVIDVIRIVMYKLHCE